MERVIQKMKKNKFANLKDKIGRAESVSGALQNMRNTIASKSNKTLFELHHERKTRMESTN